VRWGGGLREKKKWWKRMGRKFWVGGGSLVWYGLDRVSF
jgi:hypothetical protein